MHAHIHRLEGAQYLHAPHEAFSLCDIDLNENLDLTLLFYFFLLYYFDNLRKIPMHLTYPFDYISSYALTNRSKREFLTDKTTGCVYHIVHRSKTNEKRRPGSGYQPNTETLCLEIDPNLSPNFSIEELDLVSGRSITCNLTEISQPRCGRTLLTMSVFYIDELQSLQESVRTFYMDTIGGTLAKRLELALDTFRKEAKATMLEINSRGFSNKRIEMASYYASYMALTGKRLDQARRGREPRNLYDAWSDYDSFGLNVMLYLYSILNDNFLDTGGKIHLVNNHFIDTRRLEWKPMRHLYTEQEMAELDAVMEYYRLNRSYVQKLIEECQGPYSFDQEKFKARLNLSKHWRQ